MSKDNLKPNRRVQLDFNESDKIAQALIDGMISALDPMYVAEDAKLSKAFGGAVMQHRVKLGGSAVLVEFKTEPDEIWSTVARASAGLKNGTPIIRMSLNGDQPISWFKKWAASNQISRVFRHEATHVLDPRVLAQIAPKYASSDAADEVYANDPAEVKAFGNELIFDITRIMKNDFGNKRNQAWRNQLRELIDSAFKKEPYSLMNESNRRRIIRDIYQSFDEVPRY
jgi:hypothetical protein